MSEVAEYTNGGAVATPEPSHAMTLVERALERGADLATIEKLMDLQERQERSLARKAFDAAMAALRADLPEIVKKREVDYTSSKGRTNYRYEDLALVTEALSPAMAKHGLAFRWRTNQDAGRVRVTCVISHAQGHAEETTLEAANDVSGGKNAIQAIGSTVTYLQRYTLKAAVGVAAAPDDDGNPPSKAEIEFDEGPWLNKIEAMDAGTIAAVQAELQARADKMPPTKFKLIKGAFVARVKRIKELEANNAATQS